MNLKRKIASHFPRIGMRIIKSAVAVLCCFIFYHYFHRRGNVFESQLAALWCIQPFRENSISNALQRTVGTCIGGLFGLIAILIDRNILVRLGVGEIGYYILVSFAIVAVLYITLLFNQRNAAYFSCVVLLSVVVNHVYDANPYLFVWNRMTDTLIGLIIGMLINELRIPRRKINDVLFISGMDDTLLASNEQLSDYSRIELNRMLSEGAQFTVSTMRTPASLMEPLRGIHLKLPVIAMDGAAMYDIHTNEYLRAYVISSELATSVREFLDTFHVNYFMNMLMDNILVIQYKELINEAEKDMYEKARYSPYRNYTDKELFPDADCVYFMMILEEKKALELYDAICSQEMFTHLRVTTYPSREYPGYQYIKIFNKNATREHMIHYLQKETGLNKTITFGNVEGEYDIVIDGYNNNQVVKELKKRYRPFYWSKKSHDKGKSTTPTGRKSSCRNEK
ncbi:MAG: HAD hydrolase family protein [Eubacteriales bacterium]|nr:HAD hydrolase family protein [Eubacteriales bacterium]